MAKYRLKFGKHYRTEDRQLKRYDAGDVFEPNECELRVFGDKLEEVVEQVNPPDEVEEPATIDSDSENAEQNLFLADLFVETLGIEILQALAAAHIVTVQQLATIAIAADPDALAKVKGIGKARARRIRQALMAMDAQES